MPLPDPVIMPLRHVYLRAKERPAGYVGDVMRYATKIDERRISIPLADYEALKAKYRKAPPMVTGLPAEDLSGFDPEEELRRLRAGGCCGKPSVADGTP